MKNQLAKLVDKLQKKPQWISKRALNFALGSTIKFVGTAGVECVSLSQEKAIFKLKNRKKVRNHIGSVHAAATSLLAETASGLVLGMNIPDDKTPLMKSMHIDYIKRSSGDLLAEAIITQQQIEMLYQQDKGETLIQVKVTDQEGNEPVLCQMLWAWVPKLTKPL
ncbi:DUF4442 domain-containing protein [Aliikangiella sp. IMCC44653]